MSRSKEIPEPKQLPSGNWHILLKINGTPHSITRKTPEECIAEAKFLKSAAATNRKIAELNVAPKDTLGAVIDRYIKDREHVLSPSTIRNYKQNRKIRFQSIMDRRVRDIKNWQAAINLEAKDCSPKTLRGAWGVITAALNAEGYPIPSVSLPQVQSKPRPFLDPDQVKALIVAVHGLPCEIGVLLGLHGLRNSEIYGLKWENVDLEKGCFLVDGAVVMGSNGYTEKKTNKNQSSKRTVPILIPELKETLAAVPDSDRTGTVMKGFPNMLYKQLRKTCKENGLPEICVHSLRHSFASLAYHLNVPAKVTQSIGGWNDANTVSKIYTHIAQQDIDHYGNEIKSFFNHDTH